MTVNFFSHTGLPGKREAGFTLVELLVVVAIIALIGSIAIPNLSPANARLKQATRELYGNLQRARMEAVKTNQDVGIVFDTMTNNHRYLLCQNANTDNDCTDAGETIITTVNLSSYGSGVQYCSFNPADPAPLSCPEADGVSYGGVSNNNTVVFDPSGRPNTLGYVYLQNNKRIFPPPANSSPPSIYRVGTPSLAGVVVSKKWTNNSWQ